jgi:hypothetical protein
MCIKNVGDIPVHFYSFYYFKNFIVILSVMKCLILHKIATDLRILGFKSANPETILHTKLADFIMDHELEMRTYLQEEEIASDICTSVNSEALPVNLPGEQGLQRITKFINV